MGYTVDKKTGKIILVHDDTVTSCTRRYRIVKGRKTAGNTAAAPAGTTNRRHLARDSRRLYVLRAGFRSRHVCFPGHETKGSDGMA